MSTAIQGRVHSLQSMGTLDGPGVRFVVFMQGCPLACACCHNPDTWDMSGGKEYTAEELLARVVRFKEYFGQDGGITVSGGEPLLQAAFVQELFERCHTEGIHTCLDTSGCVLNADVRNLLSVTDRVLLDIKYTNDADYRQYVGCALQAPITFLEELEKRGIPTTLRQVIIPSINDTDENVAALKAVADAHACVDHIELLPFRKICQVKYDQLEKSFPFGHLPEPTKETMAHLNTLLKEDR